MRKAVITLISILAVGCTSPYYPSIDRPSTEVPDYANSQIIDYIDKRLEEEYYWLDEVMDKSGSFNRTLHWEQYLTNSLQRLETNTDDGYVNSKGKRVLYSYIRDISNTRATQTTGFGITLHYSILVMGENRLGFAIENVYQGSPAQEADIRRGDIILSVNGTQIDYDNYATLFNSIEYNTATELRLMLQRQTATSANDATLMATIKRGQYDDSPVAYHDVITINGSDKRIGYLVYNSFKAEYDDTLLAALGELAAEGVDSFILDLRNNGGGNVESAVKLCSALLGAEYKDATLCELRRNPLNKSGQGNTPCKLEDVGFGLNMRELTIICSNYSASASELLITGLRGLNIPVTLIGSTTEGKNCGMDVTRRTINGTYVEYAPITFMCYNAVGFGEWGEGLTPDIDLTEANSIGVSDEHYPIPRAAWGDLSHDIGLAAAVASVTGKKVGTADVEISRLSSKSLPTIELTRPFEGIRYDIPEE